ncbi:hypothetical protein BFW01_g7250 [Lasiodiplodia theobromae]|nr:hypothetical protein BFW01_g7250 [Lasiodiplodia theobromae]
MAISLAMPWSAGERAMHSLLHIPSDSMDNPTSTFMTPQAATMLVRAPTIALGALDSEGRPWATLWGGEPGFAQPLGGGVFGVRVPVDRKFDPVAQALVDGKTEGEVVRDEGSRGRMVAGLPFDLVTRKRVKVYGRMVVASLGRGGDEEGEGESGGDDGAGEMQLVVKVEQSLGNCPKYLNSRTITPTTPHPELLSTSTNLTPAARALIAKCDLFFISSNNGTHDMDVNHRGGPTGFVRIIPSSSSDPDAPTTLVYPEYSGNRLYQTLGNLHANPRAGLCFPDFETGDVLYVTGTTRIYAGKDAAALLPRSNLAVAITLTAACLVRSGLAFRGAPAMGVGNAASENADDLGKSPYNPPVRLLAAEGNLLSETERKKGGGGEVTAKLAKKEGITPSVARFTFALSTPTRVLPGQWVALDASGELDLGYSHMRDDDPASLNDDFVRTFTVTWASGWDDVQPDENAGSGVVPPSTAFAITIRRHGPVTGLLFASSPERATGGGLELPIRGFGGGEFRVRPVPVPTSTPSVSSSITPAKGLTPFIAGGVGITPLLAELAAPRHGGDGNDVLDPRRVALFWTLKRADAALAVEVLRRWPGMVAHVFLTGRGGRGAGGEGEDEAVEALKESGVLLVADGMRMTEESLRTVESEKWYLCAGTALHKQVVAWLEGRGEIVSESFNF